MHKMAALNAAAHVNDFFSQEEAFSSSQFFLRATGRESIDCNRVMPPSPDTHPWPLSTRIALGSQLFQRNLFHYPKAVLKVYHLHHRHNHRRHHVVHIVHGKHVFLYFHSTVDFISFFDVLIGLL